MKNILLSLSNFNKLFAAASRALTRTQVEESVNQKNILTYVYLLI